MKLRVKYCLMASFIFSLFLYQQSFGAAGDTVWIDAKIRDFHADGSHPDFQNPPAGCPGKGYVLSKIDTTDQKSDFPGDNRGPRRSPSAQCIASDASFSDWYNDKAPSVNRPFSVRLPFVEDANGMLTFRDDNFFPLDTHGIWSPVSLSNPPLPTFGTEGLHDDETSLNPPTGPLRNFSFTTEFHATFTYFKGKNQIFKFTGDDDCWAFINDSLVIDLGGKHGALTDSVNLDLLPAGFLQDKKSYQLDFFHAERMIYESHVWITTSIQLQPRVKTLFLKAKVRDVQRYGMPNGVADFENEKYLEPLKGMVLPYIDTTDLYSIFPGDNRGPRLTALGRSGAEITNDQTFHCWYNDTDTVVNRPFWYTIKLGEVTPGVWGIDNNAYFPLDKDSAWQPFYPNGPMPFQGFGMNDPKFDALGHNYSFTTEIHSMVTYNKGAGQFFKFCGDDDVWVFVKDSLVIDLGGLHNKACDSIWLDSIRSGFLQDGQDYRFDFFHAERHTVSSNLSILTNFRLTTFDQPGIAASAWFSNHAGFSDTTSNTQAFVKTGDTLWVQVYGNSKSPGIDQTSVVLSGPGGEKETVTLTETSGRSGTYRGYILWGSTTGTPTPENGRIEVPANKITLTVADPSLADSIPTKISFKTAAVAFAPGIRFMNNGRFFVNQDGLVTFFKLDGKTVARMAVRAGTHYAVSGIKTSGILVFAYKTKGTTIKGKFIGKAY
ncbi:MAG: fibro-slime domain-containing protein [Chitinivibrionales bacterium]|nr:fibro-slime domain-containing protein [Chitinivibrionales bacterium]